MLHLILDSSGQYAQWILAEDQTPLGHIKSEHVFDASAQILPLLDQLLSKHRINLNDIHHLAYVQGPGSFTGLRIAASALKALAFAQHKNIIGLNPMLMLAQQYSQSENAHLKPCPVIASRKNHLYLSVYQSDHDNNLICINDTQEYPLAALNEIEALDQSCVFLGPDTQLYAEHFKAISPEPVEQQTFVEHAYAKIMAQNFEDLAHFQPKYIVQSVAKPKQKR